MQRNIIYWWIFFWLQVAAYCTAAYHGIFKMVYDADVSMISFFVLVVHIVTTIWIGKITIHKSNGQIVNENAGWFLSEFAMMLGMIGTVVGFIYTLVTTLGAANVGVDANQMRVVISELAKGVGTAGWTTLFGLIAAACIKIQMNNVESINHDKED